MKKINWFQEVPARYRNVPFEITVSFEVANGARVKENDIIAICKSSAPNFEFVIHSQGDGYYCRTASWQRHLQFDPQEHNDLKADFIKGGCSVEEFLDIWYGIGGVHATFEEWCDEEYNFPYKVGIDNITKLKFVNIGRYCIAQKRHDSLKDVVFGNLCDIQMGLKQNKPLLTLIVPKSLNIKKGDVVYFCDANSSYLGLNVTTAPCSEDRVNVSIDFNLINEDIHSLCENDFEKMIVVHKNGYQRLTIENLWVKDHGESSWRKTALEPSATTFRRYANAYKQALQDIGFIFEKKTQVGAGTDNIKLDPCFVYLMSDSKNGFYKIGISKMPEYREKTLQSEKPSIEMVCAKEYPSRKIAEAIEWALHKVYADKRIRGEWFELSNEDVVLLQKTLH